MSSQALAHAVEDAFGLRSGSNSTCNTPSVIKTVLGSTHKKTIIFEAELLALVLAFSVWKAVVSSTALVCFVDNNSARDVAISGCGGNSVANALIEFFLNWEMDSSVAPWYTRVPAPSNIADDPSRGETATLARQGPCVNPASEVTLAQRALQYTGED